MEFFVSAQVSDNDSAKLLFILPASSRVIWTHCEQRADHSLQGGIQTENKLANFEPCKKGKDHQNQMKKLYQGRDNSLQTMAMVPKSFQALLNVTIWVDLSCLVFNMNWQHTFIFNSRLICIRITSCHYIKIKLWILWTEVQHRGDNKCRWHYGNNRDKVTFSTDATEDNDRGLCLNTGEEHQDYHQPRSRG